MIPPFEESGYLPPGVHPATLDEVETRFGRESELRRVQMESLRWLVDLARRAGAERLVVNGSFVADVEEPNDVNCALLVVPGRTHDEAALDEMGDGLPFLEIHVVEPSDFALLTERFFASDRDDRPKGVVEVLL